MDVGEVEQRLPLLAPSRNPVGSARTLFDRCTVDYGARMADVRADAASWIPQDWGDVTPEWMTAALQRCFPGVEAGAVAVLKRDDGTNRRGKLGITYSEGSGPDVVFIKAEGAHREVHARNGNLFNEPELFASGVPLPVDHPQPYHVVIDRPGLDYVIVMEDVTRRGGDPRDATRPMTVAQVERGVRDLARLHSAYWGTAATRRPALAWLEPLEATAGWQQSLGARIAVGAERAADVLPSEVLALPAEPLLRFGVRAMDSFMTGVTALLHADPHIGNTYVLPDDDIGFLDWQVCHRGSWAFDLAYFLVSALTVEDRRNAEPELLAAYQQTLDVPADERPTSDEVRLRYSAAHAYGLPIWMSTHSSDNSQRPDVCRALIERYAAAFVDCDTPAALDRLGV
jgi:hypothetical protein